MRPFLSVKIFGLVLATLITAIGTSGQELPGAARVAPSQPETLSFEQAIRLAIENNLATLSAHERRHEAQGEKQQSLAPLLPNVSGISYQANLTQNLVALGFQPDTIPGFTQTFLGPFKNFDARLLLTQKVFDLSAHFRLLALMCLICMHCCSKKSELGAGRWRYTDENYLTVSAVRKSLLHSSSSTPPTTVHLRN